jgi:hypothetical protein
MKFSNLLEKINKFEIVNINNILFNKSNKNNYRIEIDKLNKIISQYDIKFE